MTVWESREARLKSFRELEDGWFGPGSVAPKHFIIDALSKAFTRLDFGVIGHWAFGPFDGGLAFEHRETYIDDKLKSLVTRDTDVWVIPTGEDTYEIVVILNEYVSYDDLVDKEQTLEGTVENIVLALERKITWE